MVQTGRTYHRTCGPTIASILCAILFWSTHGVLSMYMIVSMHVRVALVHMDCNLYTSTSTVLRFLRPHLVPGSVIWFDDYLMTVRTFIVFSA